jgi:hypothetical protein
MVWLLIGLSVALIVAALATYWLLEAGDRQLARARASLAEDHASRERLP